MAKRFLILVTILILCISFISCSTRQDRVRRSIGKYKKYELYTHGAFQDYTDYGKYYYNDANIENNEYLTKMSEDDISKLNKFIDNFEDWIRVIRENDSNDNLVVNYDFDRSIIDVEDYLYIYENPKYPEFGCYDIYFFDVQSGVLFFFHDNI